MDSVCVIGGGWSFSDVDQSKLPGLIVAVNDSAVHLKKTPDVVVSMDRMWTEHRWQNIVNAKTETWIRRSVMKNVKPDPTWKWFHEFDNKRNGDPFSDHPNELNGGSSGACAFNYAYKKRPKQIFLFGFDMCLGPKGVKYWYPAYEWSMQPKATGYATWPYHFDIYAKQCKAAGIAVYNISTVSRIGAFPKMSWNAMVSGFGL